MIEAIVYPLPDYTPMWSPLPCSSKKLMSWSELNHLLDMKKNAEKGKCHVFSFKNKFYLAWQEKQTEWDNSSWHLYIQSQENYNRSGNGYGCKPEVNITSNSSGNIVNGDEIMGEEQFALIFALQEALEK